jgi:hypothetical protein
MRSPRDRSHDVGPVEVHQVTGGRHADRGRAGRADRSSQLAGHESGRQRVVLPEHKMHRHQKLRWVTQEIQRRHVGEHPPLNDVHVSQRPDGAGDSVGSNHRDERLPE